LKLIAREEPEELGSQGFLLPPAVTSKPSRVRIDVNGVVLHLSTPGMF
jgi:hypothetical protein